MGVILVTNGPEPGSEFRVKVMFYYLDSHVTKRWGMIRDRREGN